MSPTKTLTDTDFQRLLEFRDGLRRFLHWSSQEAEAVGLTGTQHQLLLAIRGHEGPSPSIRDVADHLLLRHHSAVELVHRAEKAGLVQRVDDPDDHRIVRLELTRRGREKVEALSAAHLEELSRMRSQFAGLWNDLPMP